MLYNSSGGGDDSIKWNPLYELKNRNTSCNSINKITSLEECKKAVKELGLKNTQDWVNGSNNSGNLGGCFIEQGVIRFNNHSGINNHVNMAPICKNDYNVNCNTYNCIEKNVTRYLQKNSGNPLINVTKDECKRYAKHNNLQYKGETLSGQFPNGCVRYRHKDGIANHGIYFLNNNSNLNNSCGSGQTDCIERIYKATDGTHPKIKNYLKKRYQLIGNR